LDDLGPIDLTGIDWVFVGGESGPRARLMREEWVLSIRDYCRDAAVPFFFKQWGGVRKKQAGHTLTGRTYDEFPSVLLHASHVPPASNRRSALPVVLRNIDPSGWRLTPRR